MNSDFILKNENGDFVKKISGQEGKYFFHDKFGFVSESTYLNRASLRKKLHYSAKYISSPEGSLQITKYSQVIAQENCQVFQKNPKEWLLTFSTAKFVLTTEEPQAVLIMQDFAHEKTTTRNILVGAFFLLFLLVSFLVNILAQHRSEKRVQDLLIVETVKVKDVEKLKPKSTPKEEAVPPDVKAPHNLTAKHALPKTLGFLGLVGSKELKKALGGVPTSPGSSPGAGPGGLEGSGGELLVGLGKGVHKTTVGNTGVAGLGGIGTKGRGGGGGGYGNAVIGSGDGKALLSALPLSEDILLDGGLDKPTINATIAKYLSEIRACYESGLEKQPGLSGQVNMNFEIGREGLLNFARVAKSTLGSSLVEGCISQRMMKWKFPKPVGGVNVKVNYPFVLRPVGV